MAVGTAGKRSGAPVAAHAGGTRTRPGRLREYRCVGCGYGAASLLAPARCPMCGAGAWQLARDRRG